MTGQTGLNALVPRAIADGVSASPMSGSCPMRSTW